MNVRFYSVDNVPEHVLAFWENEVAKRDPIGALVRSHGWFSMMTSNINRKSVVAVTEADDGSVHNILPLIGARQSLGIGLRGATKQVVSMRVCGGDCIGPCEDPSALSALITAIGRRYPDVDAVKFAHVMSGSRSKGVAAAISASGEFAVHHIYSAMPHHRVVMKEQDRCVFRSKKSMNKIFGRERALARSIGGESRLIEVRNRKTCEEYGDTISGLMNSTWQADRFGHTFSVEAASDVADHGWLRSFLLMVGDAPVAFALCYQGSGTFVYERIGYAREYAKYSPGTVLLYRILERLSDDDTVQFVDFGEGEACYKKELANDTIQVDAILAVRRRASLRILSIAESGSRFAMRVGRRVFGGMIRKKR